MKIKEGVILAGLQIKMRLVLIRADVLWSENGEELVITETLGGVHSPGSLHPYGYAVDLRTRYFKPENVPAIAAQLKKRLGANYDVVIHKTHIHVEYDKAKNY